MEEQKNIAKQYDPGQVEDRIYSRWLEEGYFHAVPDSSKKPYTIVIPPPNITGQLHMGHALDNTLQDILIRTKRMQGYSALWLPGTDHASIATEAKIVDSMAKEGITKDMLGREKFLEKAWEWKKVYGGRIVEQLKKLGSSCDWERERFTMDEGLSKAVQEVFLKLYDKGLIYKGERITNWCPKCNTSISDIEVEYEEQAGHFWHIKYPVKDSDEFVVIATTRPETLLGDTAVAVNPEDERYTHLVGKTLVLPLVNKEIPVIADSYVDKEFGTGCVKITPAHDPNDYEVGLRHNLPQVRIMDDNAIMNDNAGQYKGLDRYEARKRMVEDLEKLGLLVKIEGHTHNVGTCQRCKTVVEPLISKQWYVKMKPLAEPAIDVVRNGTIKFVPERFSKIYFNWMENIQDWCISRQLWWGHRIPAYYCQECGHMMVQGSAPDVCPKCGSTRIEQDPDTLDTWFSSALWPFSTLGWPEKTEDLEYFYPTDVLVTGYDIIFFWVARMIFSGMEHMKQEPFKYVFIHGIVRDAQGRKMSKSLGNGIDPLEVIAQYGTDALRFALTIGNSPGNDLRFSSEKVESSRNFANKVWNASRFVLMNFDEELDFSRIDKNKFTVADKWIMSRINTVTREVTENIDKFELGLGLQKVYDFIWEEFCDWYIEMVKPRLYDRESEGRLEAQYVLNFVLGNAMKLLHPYMPFITEEIYTHLINTELIRPKSPASTGGENQRAAKSSMDSTNIQRKPNLPLNEVSFNDGRSIMVSEWPEYSEELNFPADEAKMKMIMDAIRSIRNIRAEMNVPPARRAKMIFVAAGEADRATLSEGISFFQRLAGSSEVEIKADKDGIPADAVGSVIAGAEIFIPLDELIDIEKEIERLNKEKANLEGELKRVDGKLNNQGFVAKAPQKVIDEEKAKREKYQDMYNKVLERLESLKK